MGSERLRVAVVDDNEDEAAVTSELVLDAGMDPVVIPGPVHEIAQLISVIDSASGAALCDHRLSPRGFANYFGAEVVSLLTRQKFPAILVTQFMHIDGDVSIRKHRRYVPVLLPRSEVDPDGIVRGLEVCRREIAGEFTPERRPRRSIVRVVDIGTEANEPVIDAIISAWNPKEAIRFPASLLPVGVEPKIGDRFMATINLGAEDSEDLFLDEVEQAMSAVSDADIV